MSWQNACYHITEFYCGASDLWDNSKSGQWSPLEPTSRVRGPTAPPSHWVSGSNSWNGFRRYTIAGQDAEFEKRGTEIRLWRLRERGDEALFVLKYHFQVAQNHVTPCAFHPHPLTTYLANNVVDKTLYIYPKWLRCCSFQPPWWRPFEQVPRSLWIKIFSLVSRFYTIYLSMLLRGLEESVSLVRKPWPARK